MNRNTHQKQTVIEVLNSLHGHHPSAEQVYQQVLEKIPTISRATVYRILNQFAEQGMVKQLHIPNSADRYDDCVIPHNHLVCTNCKSVINLTEMKIKNIPLPQKDISGCTITGVEYVFLGICPECNKKK